MSESQFFGDLAEAVIANESITELDKKLVLQNLEILRHKRVNILIAGATGCGKSSTINALFDMRLAKVGQGVAPETANFEKYELSNVVLFDSPGFGDGREADIEHSKGIINKLHELDKDGQPLIDLVVVILDGSSRDLGTSYRLINDVIIPNMGTWRSRLLVAINQADMAMKGRGWDCRRNQPRPELVRFLNQKASSTRRRIKEATGLDVKPIYYAAGYAQGGKRQNPWNLSKLLVHMLRHTRREKRAVFAQDLNRKKNVWQDDDRLSDYRGEATKSISESIQEAALSGAELGASVGRALGGTFGEKVGRALGGIGGALLGAFRLF